jgi:hypothetical protein
MTVTDSNPTPRRRVMAAVIAIALLANVVGVAALLAAPAAGQAGNTPTASPTATPTASLDEKAPYYNNETASVDNETWLEGRREPTLANVTHLLTRVGGFVIGDAPAQGGGYAGPMITAIVLGGAIMGAVAGTGVGIVGGGVLLVTGFFGLVSLAVAPVWLYPVAIFVVGGIVSMIVLRSLR